MKKQNNREEIRKDSKSLINRVKSIQHDAEFIKYCSTKFHNLPVIPNERAGSWYVPPSLRLHQKSVYFKSTDGHFGQWDFNLKRLNLSIIPFICKHKGALIVDITRKGKRFPDSLSKTIPIWCAVLNQVVHRLRIKNNIHWDSDWDFELHTLPLAVSKTEHAQISERLTGFSEKLMECNLDFSILMNLKKPLRPLWIHPSTRMFSACGEDALWTMEEFESLDFFPIVCVSASISLSQQQLDTDMPPLFPPNTTFDYIQGAADDSEMWAPGLTSSDFWVLESELNDEISSTLLQSKVDSLINEKPHQKSLNKLANFNWIGDTQIAIGNRKSGEPPNCFQTFDFVVNCGAPQYDVTDDKRYYFMDIPEGKKGQNEFFKHIPTFLALMASKVQSKQKILIHCMQGKDRSVGMAISLLLHLEHLKTGNPMTKRDVMNSLLEIQSYRPEAAPTRATMKKINLYFVEKSVEEPLLMKD
ncbi:tRNA A64-2'-O-ribosylphosphate transferase [Globomyces pollinis-pini]|nr:tRNA A64-2'-O-ribosylphosphate transferase [Globomyces pollinis-pini]